MQTYAAEAEYTGSSWSVTVKNILVPDDPKAPVHSLTSLGRTWESAKDLVRESLAEMTKVPMDQIAVDMTLSDPHLRSVVERFRMERELADQKAKDAAEAQKVAANELASRISTRDAAAILGCSYQYVAKLAPKKDRSPGWTAPGVKG